MRSVSNRRFRADSIRLTTVLLLLVSSLFEGPRAVAEDQPYQLFALPWGPPQFPELDTEKTVPLLVIASIESVEEMAPSPKCAQSLCRDPPPVQLALGVRRTVYGPAAPTRVLAATTSHYGLKSFRYVPGRLWLMLLATDGSDFVMLRYAKGAAELGANGEFLLVPGGDTVPSWLPCSSAELYRSLLPSEVWDWPLESSVAEDLEELRELGLAGPETFDPPRYGLPIPSLEEHLRQTQPKLEEFNCRPMPRLDGSAAQQKVYGLPVQLF